MRGKWALFTVAAILLAAAGGAISVLRKPAASKSAAAAKPVDVVLPPGAEVSLSGTIQAQHVISVGAQVIGNIETFGADVGEEVFEGQLLARISNQGLETAEEIAKSGVENAQDRINKLDARITSARLEASRAAAESSRARDEFLRAEKLYNRQAVLQREGATPRQVYERAAAEYEKNKKDFESLDAVARGSASQIGALEQELQALKRILDERTKTLEDAKTSLMAAEVRAPAAGIVVARKGKTGEPVPPENDNEIFRIATDSVALEVLLEPEPPVLRQLKQGQEAMIFQADIGGEGLPGKVKEVRHDGKVVVEFVSPYPEIKPGMTAQVRIKI